MSLLHLIKDFSLCLLEIWMMYWTIVQIMMLWLLVES